MGVVHYKKPHAKAIRRSPSSKNPYLHLLVKLYQYLAKRTKAKFNQSILKRLIMSKINRPPVSLGRIAKLVQRGDLKDKVVVVVGTITDDVTLYDVPKVTVAALRVTETARARILKAGGEVLTLDEFARRAPKGENAQLVRSSRGARKQVRHFGFGPHKNKAPKILNNKGHKKEKGRGRRKSRAFKV